MTWRQQTAAVVLSVTVIACAGVPIPPAETAPSAMRVIDQPCSDANATLDGPTRRGELGSLEYAVPARWVPDDQSLNGTDYNLQKTGAVLHVWKGGSFVFQPRLPLNSVQCDVVKGDTTIAIVSTMLQQGVTSYRVDVSWAPLVDGQHVYMQLVTRFPEHLKQIRGVIESVRSQSVNTATKP